MFAAMCNVIALTVSGFGTERPLTRECATAHLGAAVEHG
jgi:hypothetical protein